LFNQAQSSSIKVTKGLCLTFDPRPFIIPKFLSALAKFK
jgi:hypothetical protein